MKDLERFLIEANEHGYASGNPGVKEEDGSTTIVYPPEGDVDSWSFKDHFYGGEPYGGQEVIFRDGRPYWTMVYYGSVYEEADLKRVYAFLQKALIQPQEGIPVRGPVRFQDAGMLYKNSTEGDLHKFYGSEYILDEAGDELYYAYYVGGLVDQRRE